MVILGAAVVYVPIAFLFEDLGLGLAPLIAAVGICAINLPLYMRARGFDKSMSPGHLPFLIPVVIYLTVRLADGLAVWVALFYFMCTVLSICLLFDIYDTYEWFWNKNYEVVSCDDPPPQIEK
jgi:hypothetical protein